MVINFDPTTPQQESRIQSEPIRTNFNVLNDRTNQLTPAATSPISTQIKIGAANKIYFEDNYYAPFTGGSLDLGSLTTGISSFIAPNTYKEIVVYYDVINRQGTLKFIEGAETAVYVRNTEQLLNGSWNGSSFNYNTQIDPTTGTPASTNLLAGKVIICSILVTNNGTTGVRGQIVEISNNDIVDLRPFMQRGGNIKSLDEHINTDSLVAAHPNALITNSIISVTGGSNVPTVQGSVTNSNVVVVGSGQTDLFTIGTIIRIPTTPVSDIRLIPTGTTYVTAQIVSKNPSPANQLILDRNITVSSGSFVIHGEITQDRLSYDVAFALIERTNSSFIKVQTVGGLSVFKLGDGLVDNDSVSSSAAIAWTKISKSGSNLTDLVTRNHSDLSGVGTNTHAQIDTHISSTSNPHGVTKSQILTGNLITDSDIDTSAAITWTKISKSGSNLTDLVTRNHSDLSGVGTNSHALIDAHINNSNTHFTKASISHTEIVDIGTNTHAQIDTHISSTSNPHGVTKSQILTGNLITDSDIDTSAAITWTKISKSGSNLTDLVTRNHSDLSGVGTNSHALIDAHINNSNTHFTKASISHTEIVDIGTNTHAQIDTHISTSNIHFTKANISHTEITNIGSNTHAQIDTHIDSNTFSNTVGAHGIRCGSGTISTGELLVNLSDADKYIITATYNENTIGSFIEVPLGITDQTTTTFKIRGEDRKIFWIAVRKITP